MNSYAQPTVPVYKKNRIASLLCIFETTIGGYAFTIKTLFDIELGLRVTQNVAQYPLHHLIYTHAKFEVTTSNSLGGDAFKRKYIN